MPPFKSLHILILLCGAIIAHSVMHKGIMSLTPAPEKPIVAWVHVPKTGTSFGTTLAHFMNESLPEDAAIEQQVPGKDVPERAFINKYPASIWFRDLLWMKPTHWGDHTPVSEDVWDKFKGNFFGLFRDPRDRMRSSWNHFAPDMDPETYAASIQGIVTKMLAGQSHGLDCSMPSRNCDTTVVPDLPLALERLAGFKFVGLTEEFDFSVCLFHTMFGGECLPAEFQNMRPGDYDHDTAAEEKDVFSETMDNYDDAVHSTAKFMFWLNVERYNVTRRHCAKVCHKVPHAFGINGSDNVEALADTKAFDYDWPGRLKVEVDI